MSSKRVCFTRIWTERACSFLIDTEVLRGLWFFICNTSLSFISLFKFCYFPLYVYYSLGLRTFAWAYSNATKTNKRETKTEKQHYFLLTHTCTKFSKCRSDSLLLCHTLFLYNGSASLFFA